MPKMKDGKRRRHLARISSQGNLTHGVGQSSKVSEDFVLPNTSKPQESSGVQHPLCQMPHTYTGQTDRSLDHHLQEHRRALKNEDLGFSALAEHALSLNNLVDLSKAMVIDTHCSVLVDQVRCKSLLRMSTD